MSNNFTPVEVPNRFYADSISASQRGAAVSVTELYPRAYKTLKDSKTVKIHDANFAFYRTELAKLNPTPYAPLSNFTYAQDIDIDVGGGFVDLVSYFKIDYAGLMNTAKNIVGNDVNVIPRINAGLTKENAPVFTWEVAYDLRFVELEKMKKIEIGKSIQEIYASGILIGWDAFAQTVAYSGSGNASGLFNSDEIVPVVTIDNTAPGGETQENGFGTYMTDVDIADVFNEIFAYYLEQSNMNPEIIPNTILVPTYVGKQLSGRISQLYTATLREFLCKHNLAIDELDDENFKVKIKSRPQLNFAGVNQAGRIVTYRKDKRFVKLDMPYPMQHYITLPNMDKLAYTSAFVGQISSIQLPYNSTPDELGAVVYWDLTKKAA